MGDTRLYEIDVNVETPSNGDITQFVTKDSSTGAANVPSGTTAQRPGTPAAGMFRYNSTTGNFEGYTNAWGAIAGGTGSGGINYIENGKAPTNTDGWATYVDAAGTEPVDGVAGSAGNRVQWAVNTTTPLADSSDFKLTKDANNNQGYGVSYQFSIDRDQTEKTMPVYISYDATDSNYTSDNLKFFIYDGVNTNLIPLTGDIGVKAAKTFYAGTFVTTNSTVYRLIIHVASTDTDLYDVYFTNFKVGPQDLFFAPPMEDWTSYTPSTQGFGTISSVAMEYMSIGSSGWIKGEFTTGTASGDEAQLGLPSGWTIANPHSNTQVVGYMEFSNTPNSKNARIIALATHGDTFLNFGEDDSTQTDSPLTVQNGNQVTGNAVRLSIFAGPFQIAEKVGANNWLSSAKAEYASNSDTSDGDDTTSFAYGIAGSLIPTITASTSGATAVFKTVRFLTPIQDTDEIVVKVWEQVGGVGKWVTVGHSRRYCGYTNANSEAYGIGWEPLNSTDIRVVFGRCGRTVGPSGHGAAGSDYPSTAGDKWVVVKYPGVIQSATPYGVPDSQVVVHTGNGHGSTATKIRRFTTASSNVGTAITYADSATAGGTFTINKTGIYAISYDDLNSSNGQIGISVNASSTTTNIVTLTVAQGKVASANLAATVRSTISRTLRLNSGDVVRAHTNGAADGTDDSVMFSITQVAVT